MKDRRVALKVLMEKDIRDRVQQVAEQAGMSPEDWVTRLLTSSLPPIAQEVAPAPGQLVMEAAFASMEDESEVGTSGSAFPGVIPPPPAPFVPKASLPDKPVIAPSVGIAAQPKATSAVPFRGHSCINMIPGASGQYTSQQIQGTCAAQPGKVCHWASHVAKECPVFRPRRVMTPPMRATR